MVNRGNICKYKIHLRDRTEKDVMRFPPLPSLKKYFFAGLLYWELVPTPEKFMVKRASEGNEKG